MSRPRKRASETRQAPVPAPRGFVLGAVVAASLALCGCASGLNHIGDADMTGSLAATGDPEMPAPSLFPAVHDVPPPRAGTTLSDYEQRRLENELIAARDRVMPRAKTPPRAAPASVAPQNSGGSGGS